MFLPGSKAEQLVHLADHPCHIGSRLSVASAFALPLLQQKSVLRMHTTCPVLHDGHYLRIVFELHTIYGSGRGVIEEKGCDGAPVVPVERRQ